MSQKEIDTNNLKFRTERNSKLALTKSIVKTFIQTVSSNTLRGKTKL